jgi:TPR repeat protein
LSGIHKGQLAFDERLVKNNQLRKAAENGDVEAMYEIGIQLCRVWRTCLKTGVFAPIDPAEGAKWFRKAAEQGHAPAQLQLGSLYIEDTLDIPEDKVEEYAIEGVKWLRKAAEQGVGWTMLGMCYLRGLGVPEDKEEAVKWFRKDAERGEPNGIYPNGIYMLAECYFRGEGVPEDKAEAVRLYRIAAEQGDGLAQYRLGRLYYDGDGVIQDKLEAIRWSKESGFFMATMVLVKCYLSGYYVPEEEELDAWLYTLRWQVEFFANAGKTAKEKEYWQEQAREAAELLREMEARKSDQGAGVPDKSVYSSSGFHAFAGQSAIISVVILPE